MVFLLLGYDSIRFSETGQPAKPAKPLPISF